MLLIVSNKTDLATDFLILRLHEKKIPFVRVNTEDYLSEWNVDFLLDKSGTSFSIQLKDGQHIPGETISGAYIRQPKLPFLNIAKEELHFAEREVCETLKSLWRCIKDRLWLNAPHNILRASNKPEQLRIAQEMGFLIPNTCITADKDLIHRFFEENQKDVIVKAVKHGFIYDGCNAKVAATQLLDNDSVYSLDQYAHLPMIFQKRIHKLCDIRVTIVGEKVFATAIHSQNHKETEVDWRLADHYKITLQHESITLPEAISKLCKMIVSHFNLKYAAIDLVLSKEEKYYFLELNPNGQWAWIEQLTEHLIRDALIEELTSESGANNGIN